MLIELRKGIYLNPNNLIFMRRSMDCVIFRLFNGRAHKIDVDDPDAFYREMHERISKRIDMVEVTPMCHVNIDAIVSVVTTAEGVAVNVVQEGLTVHRNELSAELREAAYRDIVTTIERLTAT